MSELKRNKKASWNGYIVKVINGKLTLTKALPQVVTVLHQTRVLNHQVVYAVKLPFGGFVKEVRANDLQPLEV